jgi:cytochrome c oxidase subunit 1
VERSRLLPLAHLWAAFLSFLPAIGLGMYQMLMRSPLPAPLDDPNAYYASVTAHGSIMGYVFPTLFAMGFGYAVTISALGKPLKGERWAWVGFFLVLIGAITALIPIAAGKASVLYTFYPPLIASVLYYLGVALVIVGSYFWVALTIVNFRAWKRENPGKPVPLAMYATTACAWLWGWTALGATSEVVFQILPVAFGWHHTIDVGLSRTLFSITLHAIVYFWLIPAYIAFYTLMPQVAGGRLYSDTMGRITFILFLLFAIPVGMHHLLMDPEHGSGFKFMQSVLTFIVALPTLLTVFTITASMEIAGRARGGKGLFGWIRALPWEEPMVLAVGLALLNLAPGGFGGLVNMSYGMNAMIHNTSWVPAHFHLIFAGVVVTMYFAIAYELWPRLTGRPLYTKRKARMQLWLWFSGMLIMTVPWHIAGLMGQPRRYAIFDYSDPLVAKTAFLNTLSVVGGAIIVCSVLLFFYILFRSSFGQKAESMPPIRYALSVNPPATVPPLLNGFAFWNIALLVLMLASYGYPIGQFFFLHHQDAPVHRLTEEIGR